jgi:hypothetical protein
MSIDKKFKQQLTDFPKYFNIKCQECEDEIEYVQQLRNESGKENFRYEYVCTGCGLITHYREMMDELQSKWPYNIIMNWKDG